MQNRCSRREVLAAGVVLGMSGGVEMTHAAVPARSQSRLWVGYASLDPRLSGSAAADVCDAVSTLPVPIFAASLRRVPMGAASIRRVEMLGVSTSHHEMRSLRVERVHERSERPERRQIVMAADETGCCVPSAFVCRDSRATLAVGFRGVERSVTLARRGVYAIALDRRPGLFAGLRLASYAAGAGLVLRVLQDEHVAREAFLLIRVV